jgi:hypothetical protein
MIRLGGIALTLLAVSTTIAGCTTTKHEPGPTVTATVVHEQTVTVTASTPAAPATHATAPRRYPPGYPKVVPVSSLPEQVRSWYQGHYSRAVAVAPGVWAGLSPGASMQDALAAEVFDGFCASIKAYSRKYRHGKDVAGTCW